MPQAQYHQASGSILLDVIGKPKGGKADLGRDKEVLVSGVTISDEATLGTCTLVEEPKKDPKKPSEEGGNDEGNKLPPEGGGDSPPLV
jgi:hypothetical protein